MPPCPRRADRHGYDPFVLELDLKPFGAHQPKITLQSHIGNGVSFLNKTLSAKLFSPNANAEGRWVDGLRGAWCTGRLAS